MYNRALQIRELAQNGTPLSIHLERLENRAGIHQHSMWDWNVIFQSKYWFLTPWDPNRYSPTCPNISFSETSVFKDVRSVEIQVNSSFQLKWGEASNFRHTYAEASLQSVKYWVTLFVGEYQRNWEWNIDISKSRTNTYVCKNKYIRVLKTNTYVCKNKYIRVLPI